MHLHLYDYSIHEVFITHTVHANYNVPSAIHCWSPCECIGIRSSNSLSFSPRVQFLRLSNAARRRRTAGEIVNLMSIDAERFLDHLVYVHVLWFAPLQIAVAVVFLWYTVGPAVFAGVGVLLLLVPVNVLIAAKSRQYQVQSLGESLSCDYGMGDLENFCILRMYAFKI